MHAHAVREKAHAVQCVHARAPGCQVGAPPHKQPQTLQRPSNTTTLMVPHAHDQSAGKHADWVDARSTRCTQTKQWGRERHQVLAAMHGGNLHCCTGSTPRDAATSCRKRCISARGAARRPKQAAQSGALIQPSAQAYTQESCASAAAPPHALVFSPVHTCALPWRFALSRALRCRQAPGNGSQGTHCWVVGCRRSPGTAERSSKRTAWVRATSCIMFGHDSSCGACSKRLTFHCMTRMQPTSAQGNTQGGGSAGQCRGTSGPGCGSCAALHGGVLSAMHAAGRPVSPSCIRKWQWTTA